jgi:ElaB/YqjD/DUF883 family membrane-anchored ribosome-binding protein
MTIANKTGTPGDDSIDQQVDRAGEIKDEIAKQLGARVESLGTLIREHPFAAMGVGFGIGYLVARLLHR